MRQDVEPLEGSRGQLAFLVLQLIAEHSPCAETYLLSHMAGADSDDGTDASASHTHGLICDVLRQLKSLGFIEFIQEQIAITDVGRRFLDGSLAKSARSQQQSSSRLVLPAWLAQCVPRVRSVGVRTKESATQNWRRKVAPKLGPGAAKLAGLLWRIASTSSEIAKGGIAVLRTWLGQFASSLSKIVQAVGLPRSKWPGHSYRFSLGGVLLLGIFAAGVGGVLWSHQVEQGAPATQIASTEATVAPLSEKPQDAIDTGSISPSNIEQSPLTGEDTSPAEVVPPIADEPNPADPVVAAILSKLNDPSIRSRAQSADLAALEAFYAEHQSSPVWMSDTGLSAKAKAVIGEIESAANWGLPQDGFDLPAAGDAPATSEAKALDEVKLDLAILKYARFARGGRVSPGRISVLLDQKPNLRDPKLVLEEIKASTEPDAYLRSLHPKQEQFESLRQALIKARAESKAKGRKPESDPAIQRLVVNIERWRWMPPELGSYYVWNNIPAFTVRVISNGKSVYTEKAVVGQLKYATPIFSAEMRSIVFNPEWTVPDTIIREDLGPRLRQGGLFGPDTSVLSEHGLRVSYQGRPVDPDTVDWGRANIYQYTFAQAPGPANVLGKLKFSFPNKHAIYMHDTVQPEFFNETVRSLSHGCIRVREPDRLAQLLLARDKNWSGQQVKALLAKGSNEVVPLSRPVPVHLTYFTAVVNEQGKMQTFGDLYGLDSRMSAALFDKGVKFGAPTVEAKANRPQPKRNARRSGGGFAEAISGLFGN